MIPPHQARLINLLINYISTGTLTQNSLAKATGVHQSQISRILTGNIRRASKNVLKLCKYAETFTPSKNEFNYVNDEILAVVAELQGRSLAESQALVGLMSSLNQWRKTWPADI